MNNLIEDKAELDTPKAVAWLLRQRRKYGILPDEATCWFVDVEQGGEGDTRWLGLSPGDAIVTAEMMAGDARRVGLGRWILEVYGIEGEMPRFLRVYPRLDVQQG